jgi:flagellar biosynthesis/type III secretory pathway protein FliH
MPEDRIIARATSAGTRRLVAVPLDPLSDGPEAERPQLMAATAPPASGLNAFLAAAQRQGAELVSVAKEQAERIASDAREHGYDDGYQQGLDRAQREIADLLAFAEAAVREVAETRARLLEESETALVDLALQVAEKILQTKLELEPALVADVLGGALRRAYVRDGMQVVCNPADLALLETASADLQTQVGTLRNLELVGDGRVGRGGVIVRTPGGDVDATIGSQLDRLREVMLGGDHG